MGLRYLRRAGSGVSAEGKGRLSSVNWVSMDKRLRAR